MHLHKKITGFIFVIFGAFFWGIGGTMAQILFQQYHVSVNSLVSLRLLIAGILLLAVQAIWKDASQIVTVWRVFPIRLILFGLVGMLAVQYTYMLSIDYGNAAIATLLQYLAPIMIMAWLLFRKQTSFSKHDTIAVTCALVGSFLLLTNGSTTAFVVPLPSIIWGILSAITLAFYTLYAIPLLKQFDSLVIVGWAMLIGATVLSIYSPPWSISFEQFDVAAYIYLIIVIFFGTMLAFWFYIESLQTLSAKETSLLGNIEPLTAVIFTVIWLHTPFGFFQWIGTAFILTMVIIVATKKTSKKPDVL